MSTPEQYVQEKAAASGSSFYYAFLFLPAPRRAAITAFYAFCREVDDVVDEVSDAGVARTKLAWWQDEVAKSFAGQPSHPVMQALVPHVSAYGIEERQLQAVIEGCQMDLEQARYPDFRSLQRYCHGNAQHGGQEQRHGTAGFGAEPAHGFELGDLLAHGFDDAPTAKHGAQANRSVAGHDGPGGRRGVAGRGVAR